MITAPEMHAQGIVAPRQTAGLASYDSDSLEEFLEAARTIPATMLPPSSFLTNPRGGNAWSPGANSEGLLRAFDVMGEYGT